MSDAILVSSYIQDSSFSEAGINLRRFLAAVFLTVFGEDPIPIAAETLQFRERKDKEIQVLP